MPQLSQELRQYIIDVVSVHGGHFGGSLGVTEMTVALHYAFNTPRDQLVWDVGHQAYGHKILTGRRKDFHTNRIYKGLSGFPKRDESEYDTFGVGHASTSISAGLGMAVANRLKGETDRQHIAVIGDGAMTAGLSFEGMNHAGVEDSNLIVVLNDNCMSIDPNVGALKEYLTDITTSPTYNRVKDEVWNMLGRLSKFGKNAQEIVSKVQNSLKGTLVQSSNFFESLNFRYFGPVDGHDVMHLSRIFEDMKTIPGPKILHCVTVKGKGFQQAEEDQTTWHAPGQFDKETGEILKKKPSKPQPPKYQDVFGKTIVELANQNEKIAGVTPAMPSGSSMKIMMEEIPDRAFDVGIAEQHSVTFSAGLATQGMIPYCNVYSTFLQRAYDQVVHDVCIQNLHVVFCLDRAGLAGHDGATHHGAYDIAFLRCLPNMKLSAPMNEEELRNLMYTAQLRDQGPFAIRYPRGQGVMVEWQQPFREIEIGKGRKLQSGDDLAIISAGHVGNYVNEIQPALDKNDISISHYDARFIKPLDEELMHDLFKNHDYVVTLEDGCIMGGFGSAVLEFMADHGYNAKVERLGIPDRVIHHGTQPELHAECGYHPEGILQTIENVLEVKLKRERPITM